MSDQALVVPEKSGAPRRLGVADQAGADPRDRRQAVRQTTAHHPLLVIPVLPDGRPDWEHRTTGHAQDVSLLGLGLESDDPNWRAVPTCVVGATQKDGALGYEGVEVRNVGHDEPGHTRLGGPFGGLGHDILRAENLTPTFHWETMDFKAGLAESVLRPWADVGVLQSVFLDRVQLCPKCQGMVTFRQGCPACGSASLQADQLIHHFACAHVAFVTDFEQWTNLVCPKCRGRELVVGVDFEYLKGPYRCLECHWSDTTLEHVGQCLRCQLRFPGYQAYEMDLRGYRAKRLDPLALVAAH